MSFTANPTTKLTRAIARKHTKNIKRVMLAASNVTYNNINKIISYGEGIGDTIKKCTSEN